MSTKDKKTEANVKIIAKELLNEEFKNEQ